MNDFLALKGMLEKTGAVLETSCFNWDEAMIEDLTNGVTYWFVNGNLDYITNDRNN